MQPLAGKRRDPAPSRLAYKLHRMWLRPTVRRLVRVGGPIVLLAGVAFWAYSQESYRHAVTG